MLSPTLLRWTSLFLMRKKLDFSDTYLPFGSKSLSLLFIFLEVVPYLFFVPGWGLKVAMIGCINVNITQMRPMTGCELILRFCIFSGSTWASTRMRMTAAMLRTTTKLISPRWNTNQRSFPVKNSYDLLKIIKKMWNGILWQLKKVTLHPQNCVSIQYV